MERRLYKELWSIRFKKMLALEEKSILEYQALLDESKRRVGDSFIIPQLEKIIFDEKAHAQLVKELIQILERQPD